MSDVKRRWFAAPMVVQRPESLRAERSRTTEVVSGRTWTHRYRLMLHVTDVLAIAIAIFAAHIAHAIPGLVQLGSVQPSPTAAPFTVGPLTAVVAVTWYAALALYRTRDPRILAVGASEYRRVVAATAIAFGILSIAFLVAGIGEPRRYFVVSLPIGIVAIVASRWLCRRWLVHRHGAARYLSRALVVGERDDVECVVRQIEAAGGVAYSVVGTAIAGEPGDPGGPLTIDGRTIPVIGTLDDVPAAAERAGADAVIVAGRPHGGNEFIRRLGWQLEGKRTDLVLAAPLTDVAGPRIHFRPVEGLPLIEVEIPQFTGGKHILKRAFDAAVSAVALVLLLPVFAVIAVIVRLDTPGPAFFSQERIGRDGKTFTMHKFRTMVDRAEDALPELLARNEGQGVLFKLRDDPRVTRVGKWLRRTSLDELPQIWNVLTGSMSLVGPRPPLAREVDAYEDHVRRRLYIKPGLTGMWQISGRSDLSWDESVRLDLYYVENWSLTGDVIILWRTFNAVIRPKGAY